MSLSNVQILEKNIEILFLILQDKKKMAQLLEENMYDFYVRNMLNYLEVYNKEQVSRTILVKAVEHLGHIFRYVAEHHISNTRKRETLLDIFSGLLKMILNDPVHIAAEVRPVTEIAFFCMDIFKEHLEAKYILKIFRSLAKALIDKKSGRSR